MPRRAAVLGQPIAHSLSPALWLAAFEATGLDWDYDAIECDEAGLPALVGALRQPGDWAGLSLTMPLKLAAARLVDDLEPVARDIGAVNTVVVRGDRLMGLNTDGPGMVAALRAAGVHHATSAVVLGAGGTARAAMWALRELDVRSPVVLARDPVRAEPVVALGRRLGLSPYTGPWSQAHRIATGGLAIVTTPAGATDALAADLANDTWDAGVTVFDVSYDPWPTPLAAVAAARGATVVGGLDLLVHQAALAFAVMTARPAPVRAMRAAGEAALAARRNSP